MYVSFVSNKLPKYTYARTHQNTHTHNHTLGSAFLTGGFNQRTNTHKNRTVAADNLNDEDDDDANNNNSERSVRTAERARDY